MYVPAKPMYVEDYTTKLTTYNICSHSLSPACIPLVVYTCSCTCRGKNGLPKLAFPGTYFTAEYGLPLENLDQLPILGCFQGFSGPSVQQHTIYSSIILSCSIQILWQTLTLNAAWGHWGVLIMIDTQVVDSSNVRWFNLSALPPLTYTDSPLSGWPIVGTNFSEWVQIFWKNLFRGNGSKLKMTFAFFSYS